MCCNVDDQNARQTMCCNDDDVDVSFLETLFFFVRLRTHDRARAECSSQHENILVQGAKKSHKKFLPGKQAWTGFFRMCLHGKIAVALTFEIPLAQTRRNHAPCAELCPRLEHRNLIGNCKKFRNQRKKKSIVQTSN